MKTKFQYTFLIPVLLFCFSTLIISQYSQGYQEEQTLDDKVRKFLHSQKDEWKHENIPATDGKVLYDIIIKNRYTNALEIGTSTGRSAIWIAWALSKTGGKLTTIEINKRRLNMALENFEKAGLSDYIDARLADAHELVQKLEGPFDFVFVDADKNWYINYLKFLLPKIEVGGCFAAHNVSNLRYMRGIKNFLKYVRSLPNMETTIDATSWTGISISYKKAE
jgi:predicted O-methyltransferase YrrM